ncbi:MAG: flagellar biosynthetic protein FliR [Myxococcales bacterium]|nr:flagellar biosynthetic protein FliR [Myxococcales bacterium]
MSWVVAARVLAAFALLPIGGVVVRLLLGAGAALWLAGHLPVAAPFTPTALVAELALGALLGVLASLPAHAAAGLRGDGPPALAHAGTTWSWAVFFAVGGPLLWLGALAESFRALPPAPWPDAAALASAGGGLFYAALLLGLPAWLTALALGPLAAFVDRLGGARHGQALLAARPLAAVLVLIALLPLLLDVMGDLWREALRGG